MTNPLSLPIAILMNDADRGWCDREECFYYQPKSKLGGKTKKRDSAVTLDNSRPVLSKIRLACFVNCLKVGATLKMLYLGLSIGFLRRF